MSEKSGKMEAKTTLGVVDSELATSAEEWCNKKKWVRLEFHKTEMRKLDDVICTFVEENARQHEEIQKLQKHFCRYADMDKEMGNICKSGENTEKLEKQLGSVRDLAKTLHEILDKEWPWHHRKLLFEVGQICSKLEEHARLDRELVQK